MYYLLRTFLFFCFLSTSVGPLLGKARYSPSQKIVKSILYQIDQNIAWDDTSGTALYIIKLREVVKNHSGNCVTRTAAIATMAMCYALQGDISTALSSLGALRINSSKTCNKQPYYLRDLPLLFSARVHRLLGNHDSALYYLEKYNASPDYNDMINIFYLTESGHIFWLRGESAQALARFQFAIEKIALINTKNISDNNTLRWIYPISIARLKSDIGQVLDSEGRNAEALSYYENALSVSEDWTQLYTLWLAGKASLKQNPTQALNYFERLASTTQNDTEAIPVSGLKAQLGIAEAQLALGRHDTTATVLKQVSELATQQGKKHIQAEALLVYTQLYMATKEIEKAINAGLRGLNIARQTRYKTIQSQLAAQLSEAYRLSGNYDKALEYLELSVMIQDTLHNIELSRNLANLQSGYLITQKEMLIQRLNQDKELQQARANFVSYIALLLAIGLSIIAVLAFFLYKSGQRSQVLYNELKLHQKEVRRINANLKRLVNERTRELEQRNQQLEEYAFMNAHQLRAPLASILGLVNLLDQEYELYLQQEGKEICYHLKKSATELDEIVRTMGKLMDP